MSTRDISLKQVLVTGARKRQHLRRPQQGASLLLLPSSFRVLSSLISSPFPRNGFLVVRREAALRLRLPPHRVAGDDVLSFTLELVLLFLGVLCKRTCRTSSFWFNEFRVGEPIPAIFKLNIGIVAAQISSRLGVPLPAIEINHILAAATALKGIGAILFILGSPVGAYVLLLHLTVSASIAHDFYNYNIGEPEFLRILTEFAQGVALSGALLIFLGMRRKPGLSRQPKKSVPKSKKG